MAYTKTNWVNDSVPAINASNLNKMEQGIDESQGTVLFDGAINELGTYTLADDVSNYNYIEVFAGRATDYGGNSVKARRVQGSAKLPLIYVKDSGNEVYVHILKISWSGTTFIYESNTDITFKNGSTPEVNNNTTNLANDRIHKIIGWKIR